MKKVVVTQKVLRDMVREAMWNKEFAGWSSNAEGPATVNSDVDPSIAVTDPVNPNFTPQNKTEFGVAVNQLVKNLPDTEMPALYDTVKTAIDDNAEKKDEAEMEKKAAQGGTQQVEEAVRKAVRKVLADLNPRWSEAKPVTEAPKKEFGPVVGDLPPVKKIPAGVHGGEYERRIKKNLADLHKGLGKTVDAYEAPVRPEELGVEEPNVEEPGEEPAGTEPVAAGEPKRRAYKSTAIGGMTDVGGASFQQIAGELSNDSVSELAGELGIDVAGKSQEEVLKAIADAAVAEHGGNAKPLDQIAKLLGFSVAGAKQAVDKALEKAQFLQKMDEDDREILVLMAMNDYIKFLSKSGELTGADVQLMKDHPDIVRELDGFRDFLHNSIRRARKAGQKVANPLGDEPTPPAAGQDVQDGVQSEGKKRTLKRPVLRLK